VSFYIHAAVNNAIVYYHILQDKSQITITHIKAHCEWYGDCPFGKKALEDSGQLLLKAIGSELSKEVLAGSSSNMPGPLVLFRIITLLSPNDVTLVDIVRRKLTALKLMDDPTINLRNYLTQIRDISHDLVTKQPESWKHNMFSKLAALNIMGGQPKCYEEEFPLLLCSETTEFIKKHNSMMSDYDEFETGLEALCLKYEDILSNEQWDPVKNASKTKEVSMFAKLESKLNNIEKKLNGGGNTGSTLAPKTSEDGKILLEAGKKYSPEEFRSLSKADKA
jgi:hypothetical protein